MRKIQDIAGFGFIFCVALLSIISVLGVWEFFSEDVIGKSFSSIGLLAAVAIIVMVAGRFIDKKNVTEVPPGGAAPMGAPVIIDPTFTSIRHLTLVILIISVSLLALVGILAIWEVLAGDTVYKSLATMGIFAFSSSIIVLTCLERENHPLLHRGADKKSGMGVGSVAVLIFVGLWILSTVISLFRYNTY